MILDYQTIVNKVIDSTGLSRQDVEQKVLRKLSELQDLISKEGAAHIIANELNVKLFDATNQTLKIKQIQPGLNSVNVLGKVINIDEVRTFQKNNRQGKIGSMIIGDETGTVRLVIWDENLISIMKDIHEGYILKISNAYTKLRSTGSVELHLGNKASFIINPENETVDDVKITVISRRSQIQDLKENEFVEVFGTIVQVFEPKYYNSCPVCSKKVMPQGEYFTCVEHGNVPPKQTPILNIFFDDGTGNIRAVLFRDQALKLLNNKSSLDEIKKDVLGKQIVLRGRVNKNEMFNRIELTVNSFEEVKPEEMLTEFENVA